MQYFDPYTGFTPAANTPAYYNPYTNTSQTQPGQQAGQAIVPGKDTQTPGSKHGAQKGKRTSPTAVPGWVQMATPTGLSGWVEPGMAMELERKGMRRIG